MELARLQDGQAFGGEHDEEDALLRVGEDVAQVGETFAAFEQDGPQLLVTAVDRVVAAGDHVVPAGGGQATDHRGEVLGFGAAVEESVGPGGHELRQRHEAGGVAGGGGVEDDVVVVVGLLRDEGGDALEDRRLVRAGGLGREIQVLAYLAVQVLRHHLPHGVADLGEMLPGGFRGVELDDIEVLTHGGDAVTDPLVPQVAQVVGRVGGDQQDAAADGGEGGGGGGGDGRLAHATLATEEDDPGVPDEF